MQSPRQQSKKSVSKDPGDSKDSGEVDFDDVVVEIIRETSYKLPDFYIKKFVDGGLTFSQIYGIYERTQKAKRLEIELQAALHGVQLKEGSSNNVAENPKVPLFRDPSEYESMSEEERNQETQRMMGRHKVWSQSAF